ncbi:hypothetical protein SAMN05421823_104115 [Catalinimonas alkaloidigena]|uniref:NADAR domain-containing protein n=1 Tax=Catalinimonas alkaloidigena TaxID=1075417 RepID=A0A1G9GI24_9BACT|nr:NADAR family protein [Catalinimonas alkaloidigena]SDL00320.1 hypothetical protein SAMN05421823_104115 [Catalinimonas alkaloidigena]
MSTPIRSQAELLQALAQGYQPKYLFFWGHQPRKDGTLGKECFSQWWSAPFEVEGITYLTAEHYMMAEKARLFGDEDVRAQILEATHPHQVKKLGRQVRNYADTVWQQHRFDIVVAGNLAKFSQHPPLREFLVATKERILVEASPVDSIWGIGLTGDDPRAAQPHQWQGLNLLGYALMEVRDRLA